MIPRDDDLARALLRMRAAADPEAGAQQRVRAALRSRSSGSPPPLIGARSLAAGTRATGTGWHLARRPLAWGLALGLALFGAGFGVGRGTKELPAPPALPRPLELIESSTLETGALEPDVEASSAAPEAGPAMAEPARTSATRTAVAVGDRRAPPPRRARPPRGASTPSTKPELGLAEALALLHRADRAIYTGQAPWALSLLDELDARAPQKLLREERLATRVLALCRDGQAEQARVLAAAARREVPASIYGALLERGCDEGVNE